MECIEAIREYRDNKDKYLPLIDHEKKHFQSRVYYGDCSGYFMNENRPM